MPPLKSAGLVTVKAGGLLEGEVHAEHLVVEDGGGLKAELHIAPEIGSCSRTELRSTVAAGFTPASCHTC